MIDRNSMPRGEVIYKLLATDNINVKKQTTQIVHYA